MPVRVLSPGICWDGALADSTVAGRRWVLSAMQAHGQGLVRMLWRILGNESDVCDAYQETFLQLAHHEGGIRPANVRAYVYRTANNAAISMLRRRKAHDRACRMLVERARAGGEASGVADMDAVRLREALRACIARLPDRLRNVVVLKDLAELRYSQVADILGISVATARVYRCQAVRLLSGWMGRLDRER